jgi:hypothetical protein
LRRSDHQIGGLPYDWQPTGSLAHSRRQRTIWQTSSHRNVKKARAIATEEGRFVNFQDLVTALKDPELIAECSAVLALAHNNYGTTAQSVRLCIGYFISVCAGEVDRMPKLPASVVKRAAGKRLR